MSMTTAETQVTYQYDPLPQGHVTRVLTLHPGQHDDEIRIDIAPLAWGIGSMRHVAALSYVWGDAEDRVPIKVEAEGYTLLVTRNLASALAHLRCPDRRRLLWVDAVCINQQDEKERTAQVAMMGKFYRLAKVVLVWLGEERDDSSYALERLEYIGTKVKVDWASNTRYWLPGQEHHEGLEWYPLQEARGWWALYHLLSRPWFQRLWIRQEVQMATHALVICGHYTLAWNMFKSGIFMVTGYWLAVQHRTAFLAYGKPVIEKFDRYWELLWIVCLSPQYHLDQLRGHLKHSQCFDPRDKLYGILSLLAQDEAVRIVPRYDISAEQLYQDVTIQYIESEGDLSLICQCELRPDAGLQLPSWVPDWSVDPIRNPISVRTTMWASAGIARIAAFDRDLSALFVHGVHIAAVGSVHPWDESAQSFVEWVWDIWHQILDMSVIPKCYRVEELLSRFCETLCCGSFRHTRVPRNENYPDKEESIVLFRELVGDSYGDALSWSDAQKQDGPAWDLYEEWATLFCKNRSFVVTDQGGFALGPSSAQPGDRLSILLGCNDNMLLRETERGWQIVGCAYVFGAAHGEPLVGALPEHLRCVHFFHPKSGGWLVGFQDTRTQSAPSLFDPRLTRLSIDLATHKEWWSFDLATHKEWCEEGYRFGLDVNAETLRNAGIAVESIKLI